MRGPALIDISLPTALGELTWDRVAGWLLGDGLRILITIVAALLIRWVAHRAVNRFVDLSTSKGLRKAVESQTRAGRVLGQATGLSNERHAQRVRTLGTVLRSLITIVTFGVTLLTIMALVGIPLAPLLASAGVGGVALGFGAQSLVKDFLSGIFMIAEDQYGVGDIIDTGEAVGTVEDISLRITRLRDANGVAWYIRNGEIIRIGNKSQGWSTAIVDIAVAYDQDVDTVQLIMRDAIAGMHTESGWESHLLAPPEVVGIESINGPSVTIRTTARCLPGDNFGVQREVRERLKRALDAAGVKAPPTQPYGLR